MRCAAFFDSTIVQRRLSCSALTLGRSIYLNRSSLSARSLTVLVFSVFLFSRIGSSLFLHFLCRSPWAIYNIVIQGVIHYTYPFYVAAMVTLTRPPTVRVLQSFATPALVFLCRLRSYSALIPATNTENRCQILS